MSDKPVLVPKGYTYLGEMTDDDDKPLYYLVKEGKVNILTLDRAGLIKLWKETFNNKTSDKDTEEKI